MGFCTVVNCMDGRVQLPVINYLKNKSGHENVDSITAAGPVRIFADHHSSEFDFLRGLIDISINKHGSSFLVIAAHEDCAGNQVSKDIQLKQLKEAVNYLKEIYPDVKVSGIWLDKSWQVTEYC